GRLLLDERGERGDISIRRIACERWRVNDRYFGHFRGSDLARGRVSAAAEHDDLDGVPQRVRSANSLPGRAIQFSAALFANYNDHEITLASSRRCFTSPRDASAGDPETI